MQTAGGLIYVHVLLKAASNCSRHNNADARFVNHMILHPASARLITRAPILHQGKGTHRSARHDHAHAYATHLQPLVLHAHCTVQVPSQCSAASASTAISIEILSPSIQKSFTQCFKASSCYSIAAMPTHLPSSFSPQPATRTTCTVAQPITREMP